MAETTSRKTAPMRAQILEAAEAAVLAKGFNATSIDELIVAVGISKSGFFYHFKDKATLARALLERYVEAENVLFDEVSRRATELSEDPLHRFLVELKMLAEVMQDIPNIRNYNLFGSWLVDSANANVFKPNFAVVTLKRDVASDSCAVRRVINPF